MTERIRLDDLTDDALDRLRERLTAAEDAIARVETLRDVWSAAPDPLARALAADLTTTLRAPEPEPRLHPQLAAAIGSILNEHPEHHRIDEHEHVLDAITTAVLDIVLPHGGLLSTRTRVQHLENLHEESARRYTAAIARVDELLAENAELVRQRAHLIESNTEQRAVIERVRAALRNPGALGWRQRIRVALAGTPCDAGSNNRDALGTEQCGLTAGHTGRQADDTLTRPAAPA
ncbi:hypothetical protein [Streptomyces sp. MNP-20]|uniref:hypothetical protein n=1 Tax=Streptomyces sp. MNP-20 TaxID=2721165 RepID=UPI001553032F|nr:hypothetical protein [Streptomyces sp. MNP-20]